MGPKLYDHLSLVNKKLTAILSFGWLSWLCKFILLLLDYLYQLVLNYGVAIILLSLVLKLPLIPLALFSRKKVEAYQKHQPFIQRIRNKYRKDQAMMQQELMRYHKDHGLSPTSPIIGCLPVLMQLPLLYALYRVLGNYLDLYHAPFFGWIVDLSAKDPYYIMPVLMGLTTLLQQHVSPTPGADPKQKVVMSFFALVMTVVFSSFPAGVVLFWLMNNVLAIAEGLLYQRFIK